MKLYLWRTFIRLAHDRNPVHRCFPTPITYWEKRETVSILFFYPVTNTWEINTCLLHQVLARGKEMTPAVAVPSFQSRRIVPEYQIPVQEVKAWHCQASFLHLVQVSLEDISMCHCKRPQNIKDLFLGPYWAVCSNTLALSLGALPSENAKVKSKDTRWEPKSSRSDTFP